MKLLIPGLFCSFLALPALADEAMLSLIKQCAPSVGWSTMSAIVNVESNGHMYAMADAGPKHLPWSVRKSMVRSFFFSSKEETASFARGLIAQGHTVSLGLTQINDRNLPRLGLSIEQVLDPCTNVSTGAKILTEFYDKAVRQYGRSEKALQAAISAYNSGNFVRGFENGYVNRVIAAAGVIPSLKSGPQPRRGRGANPAAGPVLAIWTQSARVEERRQSRQALLKAARESPLAEVKVTFEDPTNDKTDKPRDSL
ncbi:lytic transglycosylase domain-containing protein [Chromobacterium piscinae]|uniref:lytic transglycosylase domain-containing protein n=1 Tax=Chromobacterium piscinae TaxID=686831 RepID=UPI001E37C9F5|nr:lytic transglycosylase domain-containing protein [Chromobacterium piscinae]MCD5327959.1 lytic transglycosylase domain-containing protein [Chromobacterium piscinae]